MLSENICKSKLSEKKRVQALPELNPPMAVRLKFCKVGTLQYISHLDLQRTFNRIINRACLPVWYTKGFNPHIKLVFSTPLSVGAQSVCEYLDIKIDREMPLEEIKDRLNREMTEDFYITDIYQPHSDFSQIAWAEYEMCINTSYSSQALADNIQTALTTSPLMLVKKTKSGEKEIDIVPLIKTVETKFDDGEIKIKAIVSASTADYLNPELIITGLKAKLGILSNNLAQEHYSIMRKNLLNKDMTDFR